MIGNQNLRAALASTAEDKIIFDLAAIEERYDQLARELPGTAIRFAMKACPVPEVLTFLAAKGAGFDAASPNEIMQALATGAPPATIHYGNTVKSDHNISDAHRLGITDFATDSTEDVTAIAAHAPGSRIFCRLSTTGEGALWPLSRKSGCPPADAIPILATARAQGLRPAGLSVHVGSQQMTRTAWHTAFTQLTAVITAAARHGIRLDYVNLGGGLPALGYSDRHGNPLTPPLDGIFTTIRTGITQLSQASPAPLEFIIEPGRYLVADSGAIRAHVSRLSARRQPDGKRQYWLYLSCGKFNGLYEMDQVRYTLIFPSRHDAERVPAVIAGPTCDSDDAYDPARGLALVPRTAASGDPVWILSAGAYSTSYTTLGFNGFSPLPHTLIHHKHPAPEYSE